MDDINNLLKKNTDKNPLTDNTDNSKDVFFYNSNSKNADDAVKTLQQSDNNYNQQTNNDYNQQADNNHRQQAETSQDVWRTSSNNAEFGSQQTSYSQQSQHLNYKGGNVNNVPGQGAATASMVLGIIGIFFWIISIGSFISIILGIIGLVFAVKSKNEGFVGAVRTAGFVMSIINIVAGAIITLLTISIFLAALSSI